MDKKSTNKKDRVITRATDFEREERIVFIERAILDGMKYIDILQNYRKNEVMQNWGISERQLLNYFNEASERIKKLPTKEEMQGYLKLSIERYNNLYAKAMQKKDIRQCTVIVKYLAELLMLSEVSKQILEVHTDDGQTVHISFNDIKASESSENINA